MKTFIKFALLLSLAFAVTYVNAEKVQVTTQEFSTVSTQSLSIFQRNNLVIKTKHDGHFYLSIGDITGGQVMSTLYTYEDKKNENPITLVPNQSFSVGSSQKFEYQGRWYQLKLKRLRNHLLGEDHAVFVFSLLKKEKPSKQDFI